MKNSILFLFVVSILLILFSCKNKHTQTITEAETLISSNPDSALAILNSIKNPKNLTKNLYANFLLLTTQAKDKVHDDISNDSLLSVSINYFQKNKEYNKVAYCYFYKNRVHQSNNHIDQAVKSCHLAKEYAEKNQDLHLLGLIYHDFGRLYKEQLNMQEAIVNFTKSFFYFQQSENMESSIYLLKRIGDVYLLSRQQGHLDSALINYQKALKYAERINNQTEIHHLYQSISLSLCESNQLEEAKTFIKKAIEVTNDPHKRFNDYMSLSEIHMKLNEVDSAFICMKKVLFENKKSNLSENYIYKKTLYRINKMKHDYRAALFNLEECLFYKDSIYVNMIEENVLEIQKKYEKGSLENEKNKLLIQRLHLIILFILIFLSLFIAIGIYVYKSQRQKAELAKIQQTVGFLEEMIQTKHSKENKLKELLIEKLDLARKLTQINIQPILNNNNFIKQYYKIFGYNIADTLNWDKLYPLFNELYNHIADKLKELYPDLSEKELQFCCFIRAGFRQEEIAAILSYEYNSMRTIKMRLRTKMGFEHYDDFDQFLFNL